MLRALRELTGWKAERAAQELETAGIDSTVRAEVLSPEEFVRLHRILVDGGWRARVAL
jgi:16S rRNA A1518/A1519 N6-dimethyltransferase RsmA/KsgA/DIM1 with predicted DNA glycosylase/AP lyase activity